MIKRSRLQAFLERLSRLGFGCEATHRLLFEYVENELPPATHQKLDRHLAHCRACRKYVESYRQTVAATRNYGLPERPLPRELETRLRQFIEQNPELLRASCNSISLSFNNRNAPTI